MCTLIAAVGVWPERPLVVAANRDEHLDRPAIPPRVWPAGEVAQRRVLAPRDLQAGGTWLGLNDAGLFVAITNRRGPPDASRRSRGELVFEALGAGSVAEGLARIRPRSARDYNGFHLLIAGREGAIAIWSDGRRLHEHSFAPGVHWITERSFGAGTSQRHATLAELAVELGRGPLPSLERWRSILSDHGPYPRLDASTVGLDAMCVHAQPLNYGTRSSTYVALGPESDEVEFAHADGRPCETEFVDYVAAVDELLSKNVAWPEA